MKDRKELETIAAQMRCEIMKMAVSSGQKGAHIGGGLSIVEVLTVLYADIMKYDAQNPAWEERDRFILSKAHAAIGLYSALHYAGFLKDKDIDEAFTPGSFLYKHPCMDISHGIEFSGGSLGQGVSLAVGTAIALRNKRVRSKVYVLLGDGECDEGSVWEALNCITHFGLINIIVIIDRNKLQNDGPTETIMNPGNLNTRLNSLGFDVIETDGHDVISLREAFAKDSTLPKVVISNSIKGKGAPFAENHVEWHMGYVTKELYDQFMEMMYERNKQ